VLDCVCDKCNGDFGRGIEQSLARDSVEGLLRESFGLRSKQRGVRLGPNRLRITVDEASDWQGVRVFGERGRRGEPMALRPEPTVKIRSTANTEWQSIPEAELSTEVLGPYLPAPEVLVFGATPEDRQRLQRTLAASGIKVKRWVDETRSDMARVFANSACDDAILRALAKMAFNFLVQVRGAAFALKTDFDAVRDYVRNGTRRAGAPVEVIPIRAPGQFNRLRPRHAIVLNWDLQKTAILCVVTLFGYMLYRVTLCESYRVWHPLSEGRIFDLQSRRVRRVPALDLWPPDAWTRLFWGSPFGS